MPRGMSPEMMEELLEVLRPAMRKAIPLEAVMQRFERIEDTMRMLMSQAIEADRAHDLMVGAITMKDDEDDPEHAAVFALTLDVFVNFIKRSVEEDADLFTKHIELCMSTAVTNARKRIKEIHDARTKQSSS